MSIEMGGIAGNVAKTINTPDKEGKTTIDKLKDLSTAKKAALGVMLTSPAAVLAHDVIEKQSDETKEKIRTTAIVTAALALGATALAFVTGKGQGAKNSKAVQEGFKHLKDLVKDGSKVINKEAGEALSKAKVRGGEIFNTVKGKAGELKTKAGEGLNKVKMAISAKLSKPSEQVTETALQVVK